ncbi:hypothetical protein ACHAWF_011031, partial [Thalassiosira exigua]
PKVEKGKEKKKGRRRRGAGSREGSPEEDGGGGRTSDDGAGLPPPRPVRLRIERVQLEQDTGKTTSHVKNDDSGRAVTESRVDYSRAGRALIEIVSHPDLRSAHEAAGAVERIRRLLRSAGACDGRMEEGSLRCDLNVSIAPLSSAAREDEDDERGASEDDRARRREELPPGTGHRVEVKNLNSLRQVAAATECEALRQSRLCEAGAPTGRETRTFRTRPAEACPLGGETVCIRAKGDAVDYRFMPEPDLPPLVLDEEVLGPGVSLEEFVNAHEPESLEDAMERLVEDYGLDGDVADVIAEDPSTIALFEDTVRAAREDLEKKGRAGADEFDSVPKLSANWLCNDLFALLKKSAAKGGSEEEEGPLDDPTSAESSPVDGSRLGALVAMVAEGSLTPSMAKKVLAVMFRDDPRSFPAAIADANGWKVISDAEVLTALCERVVRDPKNASQLEQYRQGGKKVWKIQKFFAGRVMAESGGNAHPERMREALAAVLARAADAT